MVMGSGQGHGVWCARDFDTPSVTIINRDDDYWMPVWYMCGVWQ
jgi:hypothetical protein